MNSLLCKTFYCLLLIPLVGNAAPVAIAPGGVTNYLYFDKLKTAPSDVSPPGTSVTYPSDGFAPPSVDPMAVKSVHAGNSTSCAILNSGKMKCWGHNNYGQVGDNTTSNRNSPVNVSGTNLFKQVTGYGEPMAALTSTGGIMAWGFWTSQVTPTPFEGITSGFKSVSNKSLYGFGQSFSNLCGITSDDAAKCWLSDYSGVSSIDPAGLTSGVTAISNGSYHTCAIQNGAALCWGAGGYGQLGNGSTSDSALPVQVLGLSSGVTAIAAGGSGSCAIQNGALLCWGDIVGDGTSIRRTSPVQVLGLSSGVTAVSIGYFDAHCAIQNGAALCWGSLSGDGTNTQRLSPVVPTGLSAGVTSISAGVQNACAVKNGSALCWGSNNIGQVGDGTTTTRLSPVLVH